MPVPGSKSLTNRALLLAGVATGPSRLSGALIADDTTAMISCLRGLGVGIEVDGTEVVVEGLGGPPVGPGTLYVGMGATVGRFLLPMLAAGHGRFEIDAHPQLARRPLGPVLDALRAQGARFDGSRFPLVLDAHGLSGGEVSVDASVSSQFLSGLMLAAPLAQAPTLLRFGALASAPYIDLTLAVMRAFGVDGRGQLPTGGYHACDYAVEPDASTASYFYAAAALTGSEVTVPGLDPGETAQGDIALVEHLAAMGPELRGIEVDMSNATDVFMTLACVAPFCFSPTLITGIGGVRVKETDRLAATTENLRQLGIRVEEGPDWLRVFPGEPRAGVRLPTYEDHRMAMAFSLIGLRVPVELEDPGVVAKTCPGYWELLELSGAEVSVWS